MPCKPFVSAPIQRDDPDGDQAGWTNDGNDAWVRLTDMYIRFRFTVGPTGDDCDASQVKLQRRIAGGSWSDVVTLVNVSPNDWRSVMETATNTNNPWEYRWEISYDGAFYYTPILSNTVIEVPPPPSHSPAMPIHARSFVVPWERGPARIEVRLIAPPTYERDTSPGALLKLGSGRSSRVGQLGYAAHILKREHVDLEWPIDFGKYDVFICSPSMGHGDGYITRARALAKPGAKFYTAFDTIFRLLTTGGTGTPPFFDDYQSRFDSSDFFPEKVIGFDYFIPQADTYKKHGDFIFDRVTGPSFGSDGYDGWYSDDGSINRPITRQPPEYAADPDFWLPRHQSIARMFNWTYTKRRRPDLEIIVNGPGVADQSPPLMPRGPTDCVNGFCIEDGNITNSAHNLGTYDAGRAHFLEFPSPLNIAWFWPAEEDLSGIALRGEKLSETP